MFKVILKMLEPKNKMLKFSKHDMYIVESQSGVINFESQIYFEIYRIAAPIQRYPLPTIESRVKL